MLEKVQIFTRGGLILWTLGAAVKGSPIDALISSCLLEERSADAVFNYDGGGTLYTLKWAFNNDLGLVFVAVYHHISRRLIVDDLLAATCREFSDIYTHKQTSYPGFDETFSRIQTDAEARAEEMKKSKQAAHPASCSTTKNGLLRSELQEKENQKTRGNDYSYGDIVKGCSDGANGQLKGVEVSGGKPDAVMKDTTKPFDEAQIKNLAKKRDTKKGRNKGSKTEQKKASKKGQIVPPKDLKLDYTADDEYRDGNDKGEVIAAATTNLGPINMDKGEQEEEGENGKPGSKKNNWLSSVFQRLEP